MMALSSTHTVSHSAEASDPQSTLAHSRNLSTVSSVTLHTNTTLHSQPYEPLLRPMTPSSAEYYDAGSQPPKDSEQSFQWSAPIVPLNTSLLREKSHSDLRRGSATPLTRTLIRQWSRRLLQTVISLWSIYSTVRYLLAFTIYQSITGQVISLLLGAATGLSFAFGACGSIVTLSQSTLLMNGISVHAISVIRITLYYLASACLLGSSVANIVLLIIYRRTPDLELQTRYRCKLDVDLIWSTSDSICNRRRWTWGSWITLSALRLVITLAVVIAFHLLVSSSYSAPVRRTKPRYAKSKKSHNRFESCEAPLIHNRSRPSVVLPQISHDHTLQRQGSESTLSAKSSPRNRLRTTRSRGSPVSEEYPGHVPHNTPSGSLPVSDEDLPDSERDFNGFIDRFRQLISQVTHETEEALRFARSNDSMSQTASNSSSKSSDINIDVEDGQHLYPYGQDDDGDDFYSNPAAHVVQPYDYDQNYPADEHVRMMNGYIRRMPTIESVGSRELHSTIGGASVQDHAGGSRPPTRNTMASWVATSDISGSEPRSRPTSLSAQAELLAGMFGRINTTEVGELLKGETVRVIDSSRRQQQSTNEEGLTVPVSGDGYASTTASSQESRGSIASSFHTASSGSARSQASGMSLRTALADTIATPLPMVSHSSPLRHVMTKEESES